MEGRHHQLLEHCTQSNYLPLVIEYTSPHLDSEPITCRAYTPEDPFSNGSPHHQGCYWEKQSLQALLQQTMGDHAPAAVEEYEYEGLPPNFTLAENMAAGAFAGIAVNTSHIHRGGAQTDTAAGAYPHVSV